MTHGKNLLLFDKQDLITKPGKFEDDLFAVLNENYSSIIQEIFDNLETIIAPRIFNDYKKNIKRHLFPALVVSKDIELPTQNIIDICCAFIIGYSLPVLILDKLLDTQTKLNDDSFLDALHCIYNANFHLLKLGNNTAAYKFNKHYLQLTNSIYLENQLKYKLPNPDIIHTYRREILTRQKYYRSECHYFGAIIEGVLETGKYSINNELQTYLELYGTLRQISDEIADVEEDLNSGILTLPVLFCYSKENISQQIKDYWSNKLEFHSLNKIILNSDGYLETYRLGSEIYQISKELENNLAAEYHFVRNLSLFLDLRFSFLNRLKQDNWKDYTRGV